MPSSPSQRGTHQNVLITASRLESCGFRYTSLGDETPYEVWTKHGIAVWDYNGKYWLVQLLERAGIDRHFRTFGEMDQFFTGCGLDLYA